MGWEVGLDGLGLGSLEILLGYWQGRIRDLLQAL